MRFYAFFTSKGVAAGSSTSLADRRKRGEREAKERRKRRKPEERAIPASRSRVQSVGQRRPTVRGRRKNAGRTPEGRRKNAKTRGALKLLRKFLPRFRIPEASWTTKNARKNSPAKVASRNTRNINISQRYARNCDYHEIRASQSQLERG